MLCRTRAGRRSRYGPLSACMIGSLTTLEKILEDWGIPESLRLTRYGGRTRAGFLRVQAGATDYSVAAYRSHLPLPRCVLGQPGRTGFLRPERGGGQGKTDY